MAFFRKRARRVSLNLPHGFRTLSDPGEVFKDSSVNYLGEFKDGNGSYWFFFTTKPSGDLVTEDGYWSPIIDERIIDDTKVVGFKRHLVFHYGKISSGTQTHWNIHEFGVNPSTFSAAELNDSIKKKISNLVVCKIFLMKDDPITGSEVEIEEDDGLEEEEAAHSSNKQIRRG